MTKSETFAKLLDVGIIPIVRGLGAEDVALVVEALKKGHVAAVEISLSAPGSLEVLESTARRFGSSLLLGAGTVLDAAMVRAALAAGAAYIVSPNTNEGVIDACKSTSVPVFPGALTPTEIARAWNAGADAIKVFPCNAVGGPGYIRSLKAPLPDAVLFPCGGVSAANAADYLDAGASGLFVGSSVVNGTDLSPAALAAIAGKARRLSSIVKATRAPSA
jgi:2-dehydro-3-deoxyphosphogluconate aldolase/(4S)-4-hydroxy-2-oxoglutarate aldolase